MDGKAKNPAARATLIASLRRRAPQITLIVIFLLALGLGLALADDYGSSTDEPANAIAGEDALKAFRDRRGYVDYLAHEEVLAHHGPSYFMLFSTASEWFERAIPWWHVVDGRHFTNYLTHLLAAVCFYSLARRLMAWPYALLSTVFFATQPMFLGHAFINQKDTPFMAFFMASVVAGFVAVDRLVEVHRGMEETEPGGSFWAIAKEEWQRLSHWVRGGVALLGALTLVVVVDALFLDYGLRWARQIVAAAYQGQSWEPVNQLFLMVAEDAQTAELDDYLFRLRWLYMRSRMLIFAMALVPSLLVSVRVLPESWKILRRRFGRPGLWVLLAGGLLGFTISIRPVGGFAGILVTLYWLYTLKLRSGGLMVVYWVMGGAVMYMTWPYLWAAPVERAIASVAFTGGFDKATLYLGDLVYSKSLPWHYFPVLTALELTEPSAALILLGIGVTVWSWRREGWSGVLLALLLLWAAVPLIGLWFFGLSVYGNLRHLLFVLVPFLLMSGVGIRAILRRLPRRWLKGAVAGLFLLPSLAGILITHPYEYGYFNLFSGGLERASHNFLVDRWCTSYREAMQYVNENAYKHAIISPLYAVEVAEPFAREDLEISLRDVDALPNAAYHLTCSFFVGGEGYKDPGEWYVVHTVERSGAVLAEVYRQLSVPPWVP